MEPTEGASADASNDLGSTYPRSSDPRRAHFYKSQIPQIYGRSIQ